MVRRGDAERSRRAEIPRCLDPTPNVARSRNAVTDRGRPRAEAPGGPDREFGEARIAEIRRLLDSSALSGEGVMATRVDTVDGYRVWSATYDQPGNGLFAYEEPIVHEILGALPPGTALDATCGTGRYAEYLSAQGHRVIGVDSSPDMLAAGPCPGGDECRLQRNAGDSHLALPTG